MRQPREGRIQSFQSENGEIPSPFVGAYEVFQVYGGPEEGGWWYTQKIHLASVMLRPGDDVNAVQRLLWRAFEGRDDGREITSVLADTAVFIYFENTPAEHHDNETRRFE